MEDNRKPIVRPVRDHNFDRHFATVVMVAFACYIGLIYVLFPHHDLGPAPGAAAPAVGQPAGASGK